MACPNQEPDLQVRYQEYVAAHQSYCAILKIAPNPMTYDQWLSNVRTAQRVVDLLSHIH